MRKSKGTAQEEQVAQLMLMSEMLNDEQFREVTTKMLDNCNDEEKKTVKDIVKRLTKQRAVTQC